MTDRTSQTLGRPENRRWPMIAFRCPDPEERTALRRAARAAGLSMSEFVRKAVAERLARSIIETEEQK